jgi:hypothetical protein
MLSMAAYWDQWPPVHKMVAMYFGLGKKAEETPQGESLLDIFPQTPKK